MRSPYHRSRILAMVGRPSLGRRIFEVFATVIIAFLFAKLRVIRADHAATRLCYPRHLSQRRIIGTLHHLYFAGTPTVAIAFGAVFSALEIVPLVFFGYEALENIRHSKARPWLDQYNGSCTSCGPSILEPDRRWRFRIMIKTRRSLFMYMQGLNTTAFTPTERFTGFTARGACSHMF